MKEFHPHRFFVDGGRRVAAWLVRSGDLGESRLTPNQLTATGFLLCASAAIAVTQAPHWQRLYLIVGIVFMIGSLLDVMDGALAKAGGKTTPLGGVLDTFSDRTGEAALLLGLFYVFDRSGQGFGKYAAVVAIIASPLVSHARSTAEKINLLGEKGLGDRMTRCTLLVAGLVLHPLWNSWLGGSLVWAVTAVALIASETTAHRVLYIRQQLEGRPTLLRDDTRRFWGTMGFLTGVTATVLVLVYLHIDTPW